MSYILEAPGEFVRLEKQSQAELYDYCAELAHVAVAPGAAILDAGSGSGVVARWLAERFPLAAVTGVDRSAPRVEQARAAAASITNLAFVEGDLGALAMADASFDQAVCRYVCQHLAPASRAAVARELHRVLKPGGIVHMIDTDGFFDTLYPSTGFIGRVADALKAGTLVDMWVGRKLPALLRDAGFDDIAWDIRTMNVAGAAKAGEIEQYRQRLAFAGPALDALLGEPGAARRLEQELADCLSQPQATMYYSKFIVTARKPG